MGLGAKGQSLKTAQERDYRHRPISSYCIKILNVNSGFPARAKCMRWLMAVVITLWAVAGAAALPEMPTMQCRDMAQQSGCDRMQHDSAGQVPSQHECCNKKAQPVHAKMPCCPDQQGTMPRSCGMSEVACCAVTGREETRSTAKPEKTHGDEAPTLQLANSRSRPSLPMFDRRDRHLCDGLRFEKPVFDLKTDLRI